MCFLIQWWWDSEEELCHLEEMDTAQWHQSSPVSLFVCVFVFVCLSVWLLDWVFLTPLYFLRNCQDNQLQNFFQLRTSKVQLILQALDTTILNTWMYSVLGQIQGQLFNFIAYHGRINLGESVNQIKHERRKVKCK